MKQAGVSVPKLLIKMTPTATQPFTMQKKPHKTGGSRLIQTNNTKKKSFKHEVQHKEDRNVHDFPLAIRKRKSGEIKRDPPERKKRFCKGNHPPL